MRAVDPTYPFYPIACILASSMLILVLSTSLLRQKWNLGVTFLCFWLFFENLCGAVDAIVWSDNANLRLYVWCDIVTHLSNITFMIKPLSTFIIIRRLYLIASIQSVELLTKAERRWDLAVEWTLGLVLPILVAGPIYYVNQGARFAIYEGFGCQSTKDASILVVLIEDSWTVIFPLVSVVFYYPKVAKTYYRQRRDINSFLRSDHSVSRTNYLRILILASLDILLTLPISTVTIALDIAGALSALGFPFYPGWSLIHSRWEPVSFSYAQLQAFGTSELALLYFSHWTSPVLAFAIFGLFGMTSEARTSYSNVIWTVGGWFGWKPSQRGRNGQASLGEIEFGSRPQAADASGFDLEIGSRPPSFINAGAPSTKQEVPAVGSTQACN
ncbi:unnamed protein product [Peniophora sp. CBMAI 1063]|nr:unnamed protein product [Peniophora sp. CBMAI 1063]